MNDTLILEIKDGKRKWRKVNVFESVNSYAKANKNLMLEKEVEVMSTISKFIKKELK